MMSFAADISGLLRLGQDLAGAAVQSDVNISHAIDEVAPKILAEQIATVPIRSGGLRDSLEVRRYGRAEARIGAFRDSGGAGWRAHFVENGTVNMAPRPFIRPAGEKYAAEFARTILRAPTFKR